MVEGARGTSVEFSKERNQHTIGGMGTDRVRKDFLEIGRRLEAIRLFFGDSKRDFAARIGAAENTYNQWTKGRARPSLDNALTIYRKIDVDLQYIYFGDTSRLPGAMLTFVLDHGRLRPVA